MQYHSLDPAEGCGNRDAIANLRQLAETIATAGPPPSQMTRDGVASLAEWRRATPPQRAPRRRRRSRFQPVAPLGRSHLCRRQRGRDRTDRRRDGPRHRRGDRASARWRSRCRERAQPGRRPQLPRRPCRRPCGVATLTDGRTYAGREGAAAIEAGDEQTTGLALGRAAGIYPHDYQFDALPHRRSDAGRDGDPGGA